MPPKPLLILLLVAQVDVADLFTGRWNQRQETIKGLAGNLSHLGKRTIQYGITFGS